MRRSLGLEFVLTWARVCSKFSAIVFILPDVLYVPNPAKARFRFSYGFTIHVFASSCKTLFALRIKVPYCETILVFSRISVHFQHPGSYFIRHSLIDMPFL